MKNRRIYLLLLLLLTFFIYSDSFSGLIEEGDKFFAQRTDLAKAFLALEKYKAASKSRNTSFMAFWKIAKTTHYLIDEVKSPDKKKALVETGIKAAKTAIKLKPEKVEGYFWLGVNYAKEGQVKGILKSLFRIAPIKRNMRKAIEKDDRYEGGGAYIVLGRVYSQVPGIFGGSNRKAEKNLLKAMKICKTNPLTYLFIAEVYHKMGKREKAIKILEDLEVMDVDSRWVPETRKKKREGRELLKKYKLEMKR